MENGGKLTSYYHPSKPSGGTDYVGLMPIAPGVANATVRGAGSTWDGVYTTLVVGSGSATSSLTIENQGSATFGRVIIGETGDLQYSYGTVTVSGPGSKMSVVGSSLFGPQWPTAMVVGDGGYGKLKVISGGKVIVASCARIAVQHGSDGMVEISGPGSLWDISGGLSIGAFRDLPPYGGSALLSVTNMATVKVGENLQVWGSLWLKGGATLTIKGQTLTLANKSKYEGCGKIEFLGTSLIIENDDPSDVAGLANTTLVFAGGAGVTDEIEVCGGDKGAGWSSFQKNFTMGRIEIGAPGAVGNVKLVNAISNSGMPGEALYVRELVVHPGSSLDLNGLSVYALNYVNNGGQVTPGPGGSLSQVGSIQQIAAAAVNAKYVDPQDPMGDARWGSVGVSDSAQILLKSVSHEEALDDTQVSLTAYLTKQGDPPPIGQLMLHDAQGNLLLSASFPDVLLQELPDGTLSGSVLMTVADNVWRDALPMWYDDTMLLTLHVTPLGEPLPGGAVSARVDVELSPAPEPSTLLLLAIGAAGIMAYAASRRRKGDRHRGGDVSPTAKTTCATEPVPSSPRSRRVACRACLG